MKKRGLWKIVPGVIVLAIAAFASVNFAFIGHDGIQANHTPVTEAVIGCLTGNADLENILGNIADKRGYDIIFIPVFHTEPVRRQCSAFVSDRHLAGKDLWNKYAEYFRETGNDMPLLIVDNIRDWIKYRS